MLSYFQTTKLDADAIDKYQKMAFKEVPFPKLLNQEVFDVDAETTNKVVIVTNTASKCGYTDNHYKELAQLYNEYKDQGLQILGFPCNQFNSQEHSQACDIQKKADKFDLKFPMFEMVDCNGKNAAPIFEWCKVHSADFFDAKKGTVASIGWNFGKFLIGKDGKVIAYAGAKTSPLKMKAQIEEALKA